MSHLAGPGSDPYIRIAEWGHSAQTAQVAILLLDWQIYAHRSQQKLITQSYCVSSFHAHCIADQQRRYSHFGNLLSTRYWVVTQFAHLESQPGHAVFLQFFGILSPCRRVLNAMPPQRGSSCCSPSGQEGNFAGRTFGSVVFERDIWYRNNAGSGSSTPNFAGRTIGSVVFERDIWYRNNAGSGSSTPR